MNQLSSKDLILLEDHLNMEQFMIKDLQHCSREASDSQLKSMLDQFTKDHQNTYQALAKYINQKNLQ